MKLDPASIDKLYLKYGYRQIEKTNNVKLFLYEQGRYYGADIIPLDNKKETNELCKQIKTEYGNGGFAAQIKNYPDNETIGKELYRSFFSYDITKKRIENKYSNFLRSQSKLNGGFRYEYINSPYRINNENNINNKIVNQLVEKFTINRPQLILIEASAGYGKTCTAFEILRKLLDSDVCENPLLTTLSRNRGANIFRYILLDEIDREYPTLDSNLVTHEISTGRIPLIIDGFDELLKQSEIVKSESGKVFSEVETMLDTIGSLLKGNAKIILTSRKTAIFAGDEFQTWLLKWNDEFDVTRFSIEIPRIKDWLNEEKLSAIRRAQIPVEYIANPVLLTYLRNLDKTTFESHIIEPESIISKYFLSLHEREIIRQELKISAADQYSIFKNVVKLLISIDQSSEDRSFFREIILDENKNILEKAIGLYPSDKDIEWLADKLINHALLTRKGQDENEIGFINDFVFGTFIGEIMSEATVSEIEKSFSAYMVEIGVTAYRVQNLKNKELLWKKVEALNEKFEQNSLFIFDTTLKGQLERSFKHIILHTVQVYKIHFAKDHIISASVFINCKFKNCHFSLGAFVSASFIECTFEDCTLEEIAYINDYINSYTIKCTQKNCNVLSYQSDCIESSDVDSNAKMENRILKELYVIEEKHKSQRILHVMKQFEKTERRLIAQLIDKLEDEKIIKVAGLDVFIEINKLQFVKERIGII